MSTNDNLLNHIFDGNRSELYAEFEGWIKSSRRFKAFATDYRDKIRAKLKNMRDESGLKDLRAELETAALLLHEPQFTLEYEKYAALKQRGPDFTITFKTHTPFNVEVRRMRSVELEEENNESRTSKLMTVLCDKVGQMPPSVINLLWLTAEREISDADLTHAVATVRQLAERKNEEFFTRRGFANAADFLKHFQRLSGIVVHQSDKNVVWLNSLAKHKVLPGIITAIQRLQIS